MQLHFRRSQSSGEVWRAPRVRILNNTNVAPLRKHLRRFIQLNLPSGTRTASIIRYRFPRLGMYKLCSRSMSNTPGYDLSGTWTPSSYLYEYHPASLKVVRRIAAAVAGRPGIEDRLRGRAGIPRAGKRPSSFKPQFFSHGPSWSINSHAEVDLYKRKQGAVGDRRFELAAFGRSGSGAEVHRRIKVYDLSDR